MSSNVILAVFQILLYYCDFLRHITKYYDILRHITTYYDIYDKIRHITTYYDILRHITTYYDILRQITCFTVEKHFLSKISSFKRIYSQICRHMSFWPFFRFCCITAIFYDILRNITTYYDILRHITTYYDILRQITCFTVEKHFLSKISSFKGRFPQIYIVRHGVTLKNKLFCILIFIKIFFKAFLHFISL